MMLVELKNKQNGRKFRHPAVYLPEDRWLEVRPLRAAFMTHQLDKKSVPDFLAGKEVSMSYTYLVRLVSNDAG